MWTGEAKRPKVENKPEFLEQFGLVLRMAQDRAGAEGWWVVGGMAREALAGNDQFDFRSRRKNRVFVRDVDFLCRGELQPEFDELRSDKRHKLHVGTPFQWYLRWEGDQAKLCYGKESFYVDNRVFDTHETLLSGLKFPTLPVRTQAHLYALKGRLNQRWEEYLQVTKLAREIHDPRYPEKLYQPFHQYFEAKIDPMRNFAGWCVANAASVYLSSPLNEVLPINTGKMMPMLRKWWSVLNACDDVE